MMDKTITVKFAALVIVTAFGAIAFSLSSKPEARAANSLNSGVEPKIVDYKKWTKVNDKPQVMWSEIAALCRAPTAAELEKDIHNNKYINVYVNKVGESEMLTKKFPRFPEGSIIVKEKLSTPDSPTPELLTVMIKREKNFDFENGDWEYLTANGATTETTARGKLASCQSCHAAEKLTDYVSGNYLLQKIREKLK